MGNPIRHLASLWTAYLLSFRSKRDAHCWVFGEWFGRRCGDNSAFLANYVAEHDQSIRVYWIAQKDCDTVFLNDRITVLEMDSPEAKSVLKKAAVAIVNQSFGDLVGDSSNCFGGAVTLNLWHGVMWKRIGHDGDKRQSLLFKTYCALIDPVLQAKMFVILSETYGEHLKTAFGAKESGFIRAGYPRNSLFYDADWVKACQSRVRERIGVPADARLAAYMPTFRDSGEDTLNLKENLSETFLRYLEENKVYVIQKAHFVNQKKQQNEVEGACRNIINLENIAASELLAASDLLITDYSSCFFDYLILDRPIIHFLYDYERYKNDDRGLYYEQDQVVGGDVVETVCALQNAIIENLEAPEKNQKRRTMIRKSFMQYESADSCEKICTRIYSELHVMYRKKK